MFITIGLLLEISGVCQRFQCNYDMQVPQNFRNSLLSEIILRATQRSYNRNIRTSRPALLSNESRLISAMCDLHLRRFRTSPVIRRKAPPDAVLVVGE